MSRFLKVMIVLLAIAAMATPVMAEDMLSLGGQMRVRGWYQDHDLDSTNSFIDQRLRIGGKLSVAEGVSITFRTDFSEQSWGSNAPYGRTGWQLDRSHLDLDFSAFHLRAGQLYAGYGLTQVVNSESTGAKFDLKAIPLSVFFILNDDNDEDSDAYLYAANYALKADAFNANFIAAGQKDGGLEDVMLFSADMTMNIDAVKVSAELDYFTGDDAYGGDAIGTQFFADVAFAASEAMTVGGQFYYAKGTDENDETQYTYLGNDFNGYDPFMDIGTGLSNEQNNFNRPFDLGTALLNNFDSDILDGDVVSTGVMAARLYVNSKVSDALALGGAFTYAEPDEDFGVFDSAMFYTVGMTYALMSNTSIHAQVEYVDLDQDLDDDVSSFILGGVGLFVNF
ncbi:hypothetical protein [uncultured Desulfuromusa sp.]|uniref:hypothetical protein n=1 Tax=uncultured Desulfuromusa sp. TaxID=219183 RepID=UPI002AA6E611|nr:hypothetical protein [uncultured Desulfuromusa sp.]